MVVFFIMWIPFSRAWTVARPGPLVLLALLLVQQTEMVWRGMKELTELLLPEQTDMRSTLPPAHHARVNDSPAFPVDLLRLAQLIEFVCQFGLRPVVHLAVSPQSRIRPSLCRLAHICPARIAHQRGKHCP